jgi:hypothetical protein
MLFSRLIHYRGNFSNEKYRNWWINKYGNFLDELPDEQKIKSFEGELVGGIEFDTIGLIKVGNRVTVKMVKTREEVIKESYFNDQTIKGNGGYLYIVKYHYGTVDWTDTRTNDLRCASLDEVFYAIVKDYELGDIYMKETSKW